MNAAIELWTNLAVGSVLVAVVCAAIYWLANGGADKREPMTADEIRAAIGLEPLDSPDEYGC